MIENVYKNNYIVIYILIKYQNRCINMKNKKNLIKKLKPFWKKHNKLDLDYHKKEEGLTKEMNKKLGLGVKLEFFYSIDGECLGIGAAKHKNRKKFPLIYDSDLGD